MNKRLIATLVLITSLGSASAADTPAPLLPRGGIDAATKMWANTSTLNGKSLADWGAAIDANSTTAGAAIPKKWIGANTTSTVLGVAGLDGSGRVTAPLVGDASLSIFNAYQTNTKDTTLRRYLGGFVRPEGWGALMDGSDTTAFQNMYDATGPDDQIWVGGPTDNGTLWPATSGTPWTPTTPKQKFFRFLGPVGYADNGWNQIWNQLHGDMIEQYTNGHLEYDRVYDDTSPAYSDQSVTSIVMSNKSEKTTYNGLAPGIRGYSVYQDNTGAAVGSLEGFTVDQTIYGHIGFAQQHQALHTTQTCVGSCTDGLWGYAAALGDTTGLDQHIAYPIELDLFGNGADDKNRYRNFIRFGGNVQEWPKWTASTAYSQGTVIENTVSGGLYIATTGGTSAATTPTFPSASGDSVTDGTVTWKWFNDYHFEVGDGLWYGGGGNSAWSYAYGISGDGTFDHAFMDTTKMQFAAGAHPIQLATNQMVQLSGETTATASREFGYVDGQGTVVQVGSVPRLTVSDDGDVTTYGSIHAGYAIYLKGLSKTQILAISNPSEGEKVYDYDDHTEVTYRCPTTSTCAWFPTQYGTALAN